MRVEVDRELAHLKGFHEMYLDTMERRNSAAAYKFDEQYIHDLLALLPTIEDFPYEEYR